MPFTHQQQQQPQQQSHTSTITLDQAIQLLQAGRAAGINHVVSVTTDPRQATRILNISASEAA